jgi:hypothetical protein
VKVRDFRNPSLAAVGQNDKMKARIEQESVSCNLKPVDLSECSRRQPKKQPRLLFALMDTEWLPTPPFTHPRTPKLWLPRNYSMLSPRTRA